MNSRRGGKPRPIILPQLRSRVNRAKKLESRKWLLAVRPALIERASQGVEAWPSCPPVVSLLALGIVVLELQLGHGTAVLEPALLLVVAAFPSVVAEVATASFISVSMVRSDCG